MITFDPQKLKKIAAALQVGDQVLSLQWRVGIPLRIENAELDDVFVAGEDAQHEVIEWTNGVVVKRDELIVDGNDAVFVDIKWPANTDRIKPSRREGEPIVRFPPPDVDGYQVEVIHMKVRKAPPKIFISPQQTEPHPKRNREEPIIERDAEDADDEDEPNSLGLLELVDNGSKEEKARADQLGEDRPHRLTIGLKVPIIIPRRFRWYYLFSYGKQYFGDTASALAAWREHWKCFMTYYNISHNLTSEVKRHRLYSLQESVEHLLMTGIDNAKLKNKDAYRPQFLLTIEMAGIAALAVGGHRALELVDEKLDFEETMQDLRRVFKEIGKIPQKKETPPFRKQGGRGGSQRRGGRGNFRGRGGGPQATAPNPSQQTSASRN